MIRSLAVAITLLWATLAQAQPSFVGYALIDGQNKMVQSYGGLTPGQEIAVPGKLTLPNGNDVFGAKPGEQLGAWKLVPRWVDPQGSDSSLPITDSTSEYDGTKIIIKPVYGPVPIPTQVTAMQLKVALLRSGNLAAFMAWVNTQPAETQLMWNSMIFVGRTSSIITAAAASTAVTANQLDALFRAAGRINP